VPACAGTDVSIYARGAEALSAAAEKIAARSYHCAAPTSSRAGNWRRASDLRCGPEFCWSRH
jgi:hypothetical protein